MPISLRRLTKLHFIALTLLVIAAVAAIALAKRLPREGRKAGQSSLVQQIAATAATSKVRKPKDVAVIVPTGMPVIISDVIEAETAKGREIKATISNKEMSNVESLTYATYEFDTTGNLTRVEGGVKPINLTTGKLSEISILPKRLSQENNRLMLTVEKISSEKDSWSTPFVDLATASASKAKGKDLPISGKKDKDKITDDYGSTFCVNAYRRALAVSAAGEKTSITSFTCDQQSRIYSFTYQGKVLVR